MHWMFTMKGKRDRCLRWEKKEKGGGLNEGDVPVNVDGIGECS